MFIAILEPMIDVKIATRLVCRKLGMDKCCSNGEGVTKIFLFWKHEFNLKILDVHPQALTVSTEEFWRLEH